MAADQIKDQRWTLCAGTLSGFLRAVLAYEAVMPLTIWLWSWTAAIWKCFMELPVRQDIRSLWKLWKDLEKRYKRKRELSRV